MVYTLADERVRRLFFAAMGKALGVKTECARLEYARPVYARPKGQYGIGNLSTRSQSPYIYIYILQQDKYLYGIAITWIQVQTQALHHLEASLIVLQIGDCQSMAATIRHCHSTWAGQMLPKFMSGP